MIVMLPKLFSLFRKRALFVCFSVGGKKRPTSVGIHDSNQSGGDLDCSSRDPREEKTDKARFQKRLSRNEIKERLRDEGTVRRRS